MAATVALDRPAIIFVKFGLEAPLLLIFLPHIFIFFKVGETVMNLAF